MRLKTRIWLAASLLILAGAFLWHGASQAPQASKPAQKPAVVAAAAQAPAAAPAAATRRPASLRLSNTSKTVDQLLKDPRAVLLRNALIDTRQPVEIPDTLKAGEASGSYIAQARHALDTYCYDAIKASGARFVSYIPNNAALIRATAEAAKNLRATRMFETVIPYEPYYKLDLSLMPVALGEKPAPNGLAVSVTGFPGGRDETLQSLTALGAEILGEDRTPFGDTFYVKTANLVALAREVSVQEIEPSGSRRFLNDLTRATTGVAANTLDVSNYLGLTGKGVLVAMNDAGVDASHPDLTNRVFGPTNYSWTLKDDNTNQVWDLGHGTHVAGIIIGNGSCSTTMTTLLPGSTWTNKAYATNQFRGKASGATLYVQSVDLRTGPYVPDSVLQENVAKTNALICNNSWGYSGVSAYDSAAASYDAATRDARPLTNGMQPLLFVFAAGDSGGGNNQGLGGQRDTILSPATAKNVITVGALESLRAITNSVKDTNTTPPTTNAPWQGETDSSYQVASFSGRGNVGVDEEGSYGRYKPDVVAPGVFIVSDRAGSWTNPVIGASISTRWYSGLTVAPGQTNITTIYVPVGTTNVEIRLFSGAYFPPDLLTNLAVYCDPTNPPVTLRTNAFIPTNSGYWYIGVSNILSSGPTLTFDMAVDMASVTGTSNTYVALSNLNSGLGPYYRYESGTSMAAGAVSGVLALMQEFFATSLNNSNPSPALLKALLINGARTTSSSYDYEADKSSGNGEGWGLVNLPNSVRKDMGKDTNSGPVLFFDQNPDMALSTGDSCRRDITIADAATNDDLRVTLVWTDPPGNPAAGIKLVNDLDLIISNRITSATETNQIYSGNDFQTQSTYSSARTNEDFVGADTVNNVENIVIPAPLVKNYAVIVKAKRVNVNAVTAHTNDIVQDFALVITTASTNPAAVTVSSTTFATNKTPWVAVISNSVPLLGQRVGANSPLIGGTNGTTNQWRFYAFTNQPVLTADGTNAAVTNGQPYVAIVTFMPLNLASTPRSSEPDIDLYVSTNSDLTNLVPAIINASDKSTRRGGIESVIYTNSITNTVYYIGVKSEDQKASEFGLLAVASDSPFDSDDGNFTRSRGRPLPLIIPDGWVGGPSNGIILNLSLTAGTRTIRQLMVEERLLSSFRPDIYSLLQSEGGSGAFCWVNNHTDYGSNTVTFDDSGSQWVENSITSDGPGSLRSFMGSTVPPFFLTRFWDNAAGDIAQVNDYDLLLGFQPIDPYDFTVDLRPNGWYYDFLDLPSDVTNLNIKVYLTNGGPVQIFLKKGDFPTLTDYDFANLNVMPPGGELNVSINDTPPISGGRWYYGFYNPTTSEEIFRVRITVSRSLTPDLTMTYTNSAGTNLNLLPDDALTNTAIYVPASNTVVAASVGVRLDHSRLSDLAITLTSPQGTRVLIFEDRGGTNATALGLSLTNDVATNRVYTWFTEDTNLNPILIKFAVPPYASTNDSLMTNRVVFASYFDTNWFWDYQDTSTWPSRVSLGLPPVGVFTNGQYVDGWFVETNRMETNIVVSNGLSLVVVTNVALTNNSVCVVKDIAHSPDGSNNFLTLGSGRLIRAVLVEAGRSYRLTFLSRSQGLTNWWPADNKANDLVGGVIGTVSSSGVAYDAGLVDGSWRFNGSGGYIDMGPNTGNFGTSDFTIDYWIKAEHLSDISQAVVSKRDVCNLGNWWCSRITDVSGRSGSIGFEFCGSATDASTLDLVLGRTVVNDGVNWHHAALTRKGTVYMVYVDGEYNDFGIAPSVLDFNNGTDTRLGISACEGHDGTVALHGNMDELGFYKRALSPTEVKAIFDSGSAGKYTAHSPQPSAQIIIDGATRDIFGNNTDWQTNQYSFAASSNSISIELIGSASSPLLGDFILEELPFTNYNNIYLPEEPLTAVKGENSLGWWTLGLWDTRTGLPATNVLYDWALQLTYPSTNAQMTVLTNGAPYSNTVPAGNVMFFAIDAPSDALFSYNVLTAFGTGPLDLVFNQDALPTGMLPGDYTLSTVTGSDANPQWGIMTTSVQPFFVPGRRYYLGVVNNSTTSQPFQLMVFFTGGLAAGVPALTNSVPFTNTAPLAANDVQYYSFDVSSNATLVTFELYGLSSDLALAVVKGLPLPGPTNFAYLSDNLGLQPEMIKVGPDSSPVPLSAGRWYLGVFGYNGAVAPLTYVVKATEYQAVLTLLYDHIPYTNTATSNVLQYFEVDVPRNAASVSNKLTSLTGGSLDLWFSTNGLPTSSDTQLLPPASPSGVWTLKTTNTPPDIAAGGRYYLWVNPVSPPQTFVIEADVDYLMTLLTNTVWATNRFVESAACDYYQFDVATNATRLQFDVSNMTQNVDLGVCSNLPAPYVQRPQFQSHNSGLRPEQIVVTNGISSGWWYLGVTNRATADASYEIRACQWLSDTGMIVLASASPRTLTVPANGVRHFAVDVPAMTDWASNSLSVGSPSDSLTLLYSTLGLPTGELPGDWALFSTSNNAAAVLATNLTLVYTNDGAALDSGAVSRIPGLTTAAANASRYYLTVVNTNNEDVQFTIQATVLPLVHQVFDNVPFAGRTLPFADYLQYYRFDASANASSVVFDVPQADGPVWFVVGKGYLPDLGNFDNYGYADSGGSTPVTFDGTSGISDLSGTWYLGVYPGVTDPVSYAVNIFEYQSVSGTNVIGVGGTNFPGSLPPLSTASFQVNVPTNALAVANTFASADGSIELLFNQTSPPQNEDPPTVVFFSGVSFGTVVLTNGSDPQLVPGASYYLTVRNTNTVAATFSLSVSMDLMVVLTNRVAFTNTLSNPGQVNYYAFLVSPNSSTAAFEVINSSGVVYPFLSYSQTMPPDLWPDIYTNALYQDFGSSTDLKSFVLQKEPVGGAPLAAGWWYIGVRAPSDIAAPVSYAVRVVADSGSPGIVSLRKGVPRSASALPGFSVDGRTNLALYSIDFTNAETQVSFIVTNATAIPGLYIMRGWEPTPSYYGLIADNASTNGSASITMTDSSSPYGTTQGTWYIAVPNSNATQMRFDILALGDEPLSTIIQLQNATPLWTTAGVGSGPFGTNGQPVYYRFIVSNDAAGARFNLSGATGNVDLYAALNTLPSDLNFLASSANPGAADEGITMATNAAFSSIDGDWYLAVYDRDAADVSFNITATLLDAWQAIPPQVSATVSSSGGVTFAWTAYLGIRYEVDYTANLSQPFVAITNFTASATGPVSFSPTLADPQGFYRVQVLGP